MDYSKNHLHVNDRVLYKGSPIKVSSITLIEDTALNGTDVPAVPWCAKEHFTVVLSDERWAYGSDIEPITEEVTRV